MMLNANNLPSFLSDVRNKVNFTPFVGKSLQQEIDHFDEVFLDSKNSYFVFYAVWIYSLLEENAKANFLVNIDKLSTSSQYRSHISKEFEKIGVFHIDFSDCHSPLGSFSRKDESFFEEIEKEVYEILLDSYSHEQIAEVLKLKEEFLPARKKKNYHDSFLEIANLRDVALRGDEALSNSYQKTSINLDFQKKLQRKVGELSQKLEDLHRDNERINDRYHSIVRSRSWRMMKLTHPFADVIKSIFFTNRGRYKDLKPSSPNNKEFIVDITHIYKKDLKTGIQRVVRAVLSEFETLLSKEWELRVVYLGSNNMYKYCDSKKILVPKKGDVFLGLDLNSRISQCETMFEVWRNAGVRLNFVVYDILPILYPEWWDFDVSIAHKRWLRSVLKYSDSVACISQVVADEVIEFCSLDSCPENISKKVHSFHLGANLESSSPSVGIPEGFAEHKVNMLRYDTFLMVGTVEPRKGHLEVLEAFNWLWAKNHKVNLIIVGKPGWMMDEFLLRIKSHALLGQSLFYYDRASDEFLEVLYKESTCLIAASKAEGFGLPLIEAARYGLPIIARDIPIFREVAGEFATYFSDDKLSSVVLSWLDSYRNNAHIHSKGMGFYSWEESSKQMLSILKT